MTCTTKQQTISQVETSEIVECEDVVVISEPIAREDEETRNLRKHLAQEKAIRELERRKARALAAVHRVSFLG